MKKKNKSDSLSQVVPTLAVTLGDPEGIGPEIVYKSLSVYQPQFKIVVIGSLRYYTDRTIQSIGSIDQLQEKEKGIFFYDINPDPNTGDLSYHYVCKGIEWALQNKVQALITAPVSKDKWQRAGIHYNGHTSLLADTAGIRDYTMFFWSQDLKVALYTIHIPLQEIFKHLTIDRIIHYIEFLTHQLNQFLPADTPIFISGVNPHAGENGYLGHEETDIIIPALTELKKHIKNPLIGPLPPDVVFIKARETANSVVIAWYHDQGLIPFKLLNIHCGVNMTLGLPYIRTSPDHGTAYDIAGKGIANPSSMIEAIRLAETMVRLKMEKNKTDLNDTALEK